MSSKYYYGTWTFETWKVRIFDKFGKYRSELKLDSREHPFGESAEEYLRKNHIVDETDTIVTVYRRKQTKRY